jgi:hypothetical protein
MREHLGFLQTSSTAVKVAAWIFLFLGLIGGVSLIMGMGSAQGYPRWMGLIVLAAYVFMFFFLYLIAKLADLLVKMINEIHELKK